MNQTPLNPDALEAAFKALDSNFNPDQYPIMAAMFKDYAETAVSAYLAVAQQEVNSVEELDKLPLMTILCDFHGYRAEKWAHGFKLVGSVGVYSITLPARVLYRPTEELTNGR